MVPFLQRIYHWYLYAFPVTVAHRNIFWPPSTHSCMESLSKPQSSTISAFSSCSSTNRSDSVHSLLPQSDLFPLNILLNVASKDHQESSGMKSVSFPVCPHRSMGDHPLPSVSPLPISQFLHQHTAHTGLQCLTSHAPWYTSCQLSNSLSFICLLIFVIFQCGL